MEKYSLIQRSRFLNNFLWVSFFQVCHELRGPCLSFAFSSSCKQYYMKDVIIWQIIKLPFSEILLCNSHLRKMQLPRICSVAAHAWHGKLSPGMELAWRWRRPLMSFSHSLCGRIPRRKTNGWVKGKGKGQETSWKVVAVTQERDEGGWVGTTGLAVELSGDGFWICFKYKANGICWWEKDTLWVKDNTEVCDLNYCKNKVHRQGVLEGLRKGNWGRQDVEERSGAEQEQLPVFMLSAVFGVIPSVIYHWPFSRTFE